MIKDKIFELRHWKEIPHTTWNPEGPGVIRIHLVPPKFGLTHQPALVFLNGQDILPINEAWAILLTVFIENVNKFGPHEMKDEDLADILKKTYRKVKRIYTGVPTKYLREDLETMVGIFEDVIQRKALPAEVGMLSIGDYAANMTAPHRMDLMVSSMQLDGKWNCNQKCVHCYAADQPLAERPELSTEHWKQIIAKCKAARIPQLTFTGGEPTIREDLCELIYEARWFITRLNTNGVRLTPEYCKNLKKAQVDSVQITFYSAKEEVHNELVGAKRYQDTLSGIKNALEAGLNISINTPLCKDNADYVETLKFLHDLGVEYVTCSGLIETGNATKEDSISRQLNREELTAILKEATTYCYANGMEINFTSPGWLQSETLRDMGLDVPTCGACLSNMAVTPDGKLVPCQSWLTGKPIGDMLTDEWEKLWKRKKCVEVRNVSKKMEGICPFRASMQDTAPILTKAVEKEDEKND